MAVWFVTVAILAAWRRSVEGRNCREAFGRIAARRGGRVEGRSRREMPR